MLKYYGQAKTAAEKIVAAFQEPGKLPKALAQAFITDMPDLPCGKWSWHNRLLVALAGTSDARGFRQWKDAGRHVRKGAKAFHILAPVTVHKASDEDEDEPDTVLIGFRSVPVFAVEDTDGEELPGIPQSRLDWLSSLPLQEVAEAWGINLGAYNGIEGGALGSYRPGQIDLGTESLSTWAHELAHAADDRNTDLHVDRALAEVVAELAGATLLTLLGRTQDADYGGAWEYISHWCHRTGKEPITICQRMLKRVVAAVETILETANASLTLAA